MELSGYYIHVGVDVFEKMFIQIQWELQITLYPTVIMIKKDRWRERERERVLKEKEFVTNQSPIWHETQYVCFRLNNYYLLYKISRYIIILHCKRYLIALFSCDYELLFLLSYMCMRLPINIIIKPTLTITPFKISLFLLQDSTYTNFSNFHPLS